LGFGIRDSGYAGFGLRHDTVTVTFSVDDFSPSVAVSSISQAPAALNFARVDGELLLDFRGDLRARIGAAERIHDLHVPAMARFSLLSSSSSVC